MDRTTALKMATSWPSDYVLRGKDLGTLEVGKAADLAAFPLSPERSPVHDPAAALIYALAGNAASFVAVEGEVKVRDGVLLQSNPALQERVQRTADRLQAWKRSADGRRAP